MLFMLSSIWTLPHFHMFYQQFLYCIFDLCCKSTIEVYCFLSTADSTGGNVGLAITQAIGLTGMLQWGMRQSTELENQMTSVERVLEFTQVEQEPPLSSPPGKMLRDSHSLLIFKHLSCVL
jgi:hypothetical protein